MTERPSTMTSTHDIAGADIVAALTAAGIPAELFHSGGGCATIGLGALDDEDRYAGLIGPGSCHWQDPGAAVFSPDELYIGLDDDGETEAHTVTTVEQVVEYARTIVEVAR